MPENTHSALCLEHRYCVLGDRFVDNFCTVVGEGRLPG